MTTILVVDDNAVDRKLAEGLLKNIPGVEITTASNGAEATVSINVSAPNVVVTDLQMPEMDGLELVQWIESEYPEIPVVLMTAKGSEQIAIDALKNGAASYVPKASMSLILADTVEQILMQQQEQEGYVKLMACQKRMEFSYELSNHLPSLHALIDMVQQVLAGMNFCDQGGCIQAGIALREALMNAAFRGNLELSFEQTSARDQGSLTKQRMAQAPYSQRRIFVDGKVLPDEACFTIRDEGPGFDVAAALQRAKDIQANIAAKVAGRGLVLMQLFMDEVKFNDKGNEVTLVKKKVFDLD